MIKYFVYICNVVLTIHRIGILSDCPTINHKKVKTMKIQMTTVLEYLKPKVKALGFKKEVLEGIAADIADNLEVEDDASDEVINEKISAAVDPVIPSLKLAQRLTNQGIEDFRKKFEKDHANEPKQEPKKDDPKKPEEKSVEEPEKKPSSVEAPKTSSEEVPAWAKALIESNKKQAEAQNQLIESLKAEITGMKTKTTAEKRRVRLEELLKDTGVFGQSTLSSFELMNFDTDEAFENYFEKVKENLEQLNQERETAGLTKFGIPPVEDKKKEDPKPKPMSDAELEELSNIM